MNKKRFLGININIILLGIVSLLNDASSEMIMPILPLLIKSLGGTGFTVGLIGGLRDGIGNILKVISGYFSDKTQKRKIFVTTGYFTSSVFKLFLAIAKSWQQLLFFSSLERTGKGLRDAPRDAIIASYNTTKRGRAFGLHRTFDTSGAILGSIIVFILFWFLKFDFKSILLIAAAVSFLSLIPLYFVKEKKVHDKIEVFNLKTNLKKFSKPLKSFLIISATFALSNFSYMFLMLKAKKCLPGNQGIGLTIFLYILYNIFYAALAIPLGILSDKIGRKKVIISGYLLFSLTCAGFIFAKTLAHFIVLFILYGIVYALIEGNQRAYVSDLSDQSIKATALGSFYTLNGIFLLFSSLIAGLLWQNISYNAPFIYGSIISIFAVILFATFKNNAEE